MTLHTIGDSHSHIPFLNMPGTAIHYLGPITMKRIGTPEEPLLLATAAGIPPDQTLLLCFGEIDIRCWVHVHLTKRRRELQELLAEWTGLYLDKAASLQRPTAVLGIVPPSPKAMIDRPDEFPVAGSDDERALYTRTANEMLAQGCATRGFAFADTSAYADPQGMMRRELADGSVHIAETTLLRAELHRLGLLQ